MSDDPSSDESRDPRLRSDDVPELTPSEVTGSRRRGATWQPPDPKELQKDIPQYKVLDLIGRGGMGAVYKAWQVSLERHVAIKILPPDVELEDANFAGRFKQEAKTMAKFQHPSIVGVFDAGQTVTGLLYIVMEFVEGTDVAAMVKTQGRLHTDHALTITAHVCDALHYAHSRGVIHRDIKPANIMVNMEGQVKVADFGLAKSNEPGAGHGLTRTNMAMGTPDFVAPEALVAGIPVDHRADLYSLGVTLYNMITGEIPRGRFKSASEKSGCDPRFDAIINRAMDQEREVRFQNAQEIRRELELIMATPMPQAPLAETIPLRQSAPEVVQDTLGNAMTLPALKKAIARGAETSVAAGTPAVPGRSSRFGWIAVVLGAITALGIGAFFALHQRKHKEITPAGSSPDV